jgi:hypothetical protein|tara:strand:- start:805 stop:1017 length:213 start_codon:yes stop_codon:yes gene_type:complete
MKFNHKALQAETTKIIAEIKAEKANPTDKMAGFSDGFKLAALRGRGSDNPMVPVESVEFEAEYHEEFLGH